MTDMVNHPNHYISDSGIETIDVIEAFTKDMEPFEAYCTGNIIKYICRWKHKNGVEDLKKARWYIDHLLGEHDKNSDCENEDPEEDDDLWKDIKYFVESDGYVIIHYKNGKPSRKVTQELFSKSFYQNRTNNMHYNEEM